MILKPEIEQVCAAQRKQLANTDVGVERALIDQIRLDTGMVLIVSGIRRCGKSTLLKQLMGDKLPDFRYLNFEDPRLTGFDLNDMIKLDEILLSGKTEPWLVFDEIQVIEGWEKYIRNK